MDISAYQKIGEIPYDFTHKRLSIAVAEGTDRFLIAKGALTNVLAVCAKTESAGGTIADIHPALEQIQKKYEEFSGEGFHRSSEETILDAQQGLDGTKEKGQHPHDQQNRTAEQQLKTQQREQNEEALFKVEKRRSISRGTGRSRNAGNTLRAPREQQVPAKRAEAFTGRQKNKLQDTSDRSKASFTSTLPMFANLRCEAHQEKTMKFVEVQHFGGPEVLRFVEEADPEPKAGQVAIEVKAIGINFADIMAREGTYPGVPSAPFRPGYEVAGVVTAWGEGVTGFRGGERVMGIISNGGYTTHAVLNAQETIRLPDALDFAPATALLVQGLTAYFLLEAGNLREGQSVLIAGAAGGVGSLAIQIAKLKGAGKVMGLASPSKHERARSLGADAVFDYTQSGWSKSVLSETDGAGFSLFLDSQGDLGSEAFDALGQKAYWLIYGGQSGSGSGLPVERLWSLVGKNATLRGYNLFGNIADFERGLNEMLGWVSSGKLQLDVQRFPFSEVAQAQEAISNRKTTGKVVLEP